MEDIFRRLLTANTKIVEKARTQLEEFLKQPNAVTELCDVVAKHGDKNIRQYAAVVLKKHLKKTMVWHTLLLEKRETIKHEMLNALWTEQEGVVCKAIGNLIGCIIAHEGMLGRETYVNEIICIITTRINSPNPTEQNSAAFIFSIMTNSASIQFSKHLSLFQKILQGALRKANQERNMSSLVLQHLIIGMSSLISCTRTCWMQTYNDDIPLLLKSLYEFAIINDPNLLTRTFEIMNVLAECSPNLMIQNFKLVLDFIMEIARKVELCDSVRACPVYFLAEIIAPAKNAILQNGVLKNLLAFLFELMTTETDYDEDDCSPMEAAAEVMEELALRIPTKEFMSPILVLIEQGIQSEQPGKMHASYMSIGAIAENCKTEISSKYLDAMIRLVEMGVRHLHEVVRNRAFAALAQFARSLQPAISKHAGELFSLFNHFIEQFCNENDKDAENLKTTESLFNALNMYCEMINEVIVPYVPELMKSIFQLLKPNFPEHVRNHGLLIIASIAKSAKEHMTPFLNDVINILRPYLDCKDEETRSIAIYTLAAMARAVEKEQFYTYADYSINLAFSVIVGFGEYTPLSGATINLLGALSKVTGAKMHQFLPRVMPFIKDAMVPKSVEPENDKSYDSDSDTDDGFIDVDETDLAAQEEAVKVLGEFAAYIGKGFVPYVDELFSILCDISLKHDDVNIRVNAVKSLFAFLKLGYSEESYTVANNAFNKLIMHLAEILEYESECEVVNVAVDSVSGILKNYIEKNSLSKDLQENIYGILIHIITRKAHCLPFKEEERCQLHDTLLISTHQLFIEFSLVLEPSQFHTYFKNSYSIMRNTLLKYKDRSDKVEVRASIYYMLGASFRALPGLIQTEFEEFCGFLIPALKDTYPRTRKNAAYALGHLVPAAVPMSNTFFMDILEHLATAASLEQIPGPLDHFIAASARIITTNPSLVQLERVLPIIFNYLPLKEEFDENATLMKCFSNILEKEPSKDNDACVCKILQVLAQIIIKEQYGSVEKCDEMTKMLLRGIKAKYSETWDLVLSEFDPVMAACLFKVL